MAYKEHRWGKGELITSEKLNHMELGIAEAMGKRERLAASKPRTYGREADAAMLSGTVTRMEVE